MPIPKRKQDESRADFIGRCMSDDTMKSEYKNHVQRLAICSIESKKNYLKNNFASYTDYPKSVSNNAKRGIELNAKNGNKCATQVGKIRAQQLVNREPLTLSTVKRMYSYLSRAKTYYESANENDCGYISFLLWGGLSALTWSENKIKESEK